MPLHLYTWLQLALFLAIATLSARHYFPRLHPLLLPLLAILALGLYMLLRVIWGVASMSF